MPPTILLATGSIVLLAFLLRSWALGAQSLWYDEAYSVFYARAGFAAAASQQQADPLPYYLLLAGWVRFAGFSEFAVRSLSLFLGTLTIPAVYQLLRSAGSRQLGVVAAGLLAISPFHIFYSQETRLHVLGGLLAAVIVCTLLQAVKKDTPARWLVYGLVAVTGLYSYYYIALLLVGLNLALLPSRMRNPRWWATNIAVALAAAPGFLLAYRKVSGFSEPYLLTASPTPLNFTWQAPSFILLGPAAAQFWNLATAAAVLLLLLVVTAALLQRRRLIGSMLLLSTLVGGIGMFALAAALKVFFHPRYEIVVLPGLLALLLLGWRWVAPRLRWLWPVTAIVLLAGSGTALISGRTDASHARDDNRGALALVRAEALPDEVLVYDLPLQYDVLDYYGRDLGIPSQGLPIPKNRSLPRDRQFGPDTGDRAASEQRLAQLSQQYGGFWLLLSGDPAQWTEDWLDANRLPVLNRWFGNTRLKHYRPLPSRGPARIPAGDRVDKSFGPLRLRQVQPQPLSPGKPWPVRLAWEASSAPSVDYTVSLQLFDGAGQRQAQQDGQPFDGVLPTSRWRPGEGYDDVIMVPLPARLPGGIYHLQVSVYDATGQLAGPPETVASQAYQPTRSQSLQARSGAGWTLDNMSLSGSSTAGYTLLLQGSAQAQPLTDYTWFAHLIGADDRLLSQDDHPPLAPTSTWQAGDRFGVTFSLSPAPGAAELEIGAYDAAGQRVSYSVAGATADHILIPL